MGGGAGAPSPDRRRSPSSTRPWRAGCRARRWTPWCARVVDPPESTRLKYRIVPKATYLRQERLNVAHSQKAERLARVFAMAEAIWQRRGRGASVHEHAASRAGRADPARRRHDRDRRASGRGGARARAAWPPASEAEPRGFFSGSQAPPIRSSTAAARAVAAAAGAAPGRSIVHAASAYALALLENLVHWNTTRLPLDDALRRGDDARHRVDRSTAGARDAAGLGSLPTTASAGPTVMPGTTAARAPC